MTHIKLNRKPKGTGQFWKACKTCGKKKGHQAFANGGERCMACDRIEAAKQNLTPRLMKCDWCARWFHPLHVADDFCSKDCEIRYAGARDTEIPKGPSKFCACGRLLVFGTNGFGLGTEWCAACGETVTPRGRPKQSAA